MKITRKAVIVFVRVFIGIVLVVINILGDFTRTCAQETLRLYSKSAVLMISLLLAYLCKCSSSS